MQVVQKIQSAMSISSGLKAFFDGSSFIDENEFKTYCQTLAFHNPDLSGYGFFKVNDTERKYPSTPFNWQFSDNDSIGLSYAFVQKGYGSNSPFLNTLIFDEKDYERINKSLPLLHVVDLGDSSFVLISLPFVRNDKLEGYAAVVIEIGSTVANFSKDSQYRLDISFFHNANDEFIDDYSYKTPTFSEGKYQHTYSVQTQSFNYNLTTTIFSPPSYSMYAILIVTALLGIWLTIYTIKSHNRNIRAEVANTMTKTKDAFISTVSHELRTPLTSIAGSLSLLKVGIAGELSDKASELITIAHNNSERLIRLINDLLDVEKIEAGRVDLKKKEINLVSLVEAAVEANKSYADKFNVTFQITKNSQNIKVNADSDRVTQVLDNFLSNAAKFSYDNGTVRISCEHKDNKVRLSVKDNGRGISDEFKDRVFGRFAQADSSDRRAKGGTGLGLSICKAIIDAHKGAIGFYNNKKGGSTFWFELDVVKIEAKDTKIINRPADVLICEDDKDVAKLIQLMLKEKGIETDIAYSASGARELLAQKTYKAMTLDIGLPDANGLEFLEEIRGDYTFEQLPVVIISGQILDEENIGGLISGWLTKPIAHHDLIAKIKSAISSVDENAQILHVEDDLDIQHLVKNMLGDNYMIDGVVGVQDAISELQQKNYDLLLLDLALVDGNGVEVLQYIKEQDIKVPVIIFSAEGLSSEETENIVSLTKTQTSIEELVDQIHSTLD